MRSGTIYSLVEGRLIAMVDTKYEYEIVLQRLLADHPDVLAGDQMRPTDPRRWLLVSREAPVADSLGGPGRWWLDHLFVDQDAVPTLVEVKRSTDTRIRREVVGQMLDYAANVAVHWDPGEIRRLFEDRCRRGEPPLDPVEKVSALLGLDTGAAEQDDDSAIEKFWQQASDNLVARRLRLVFVADVIPLELQRIIEFLNESMAKTEVFGVEVRQFVGDGIKTMVPRVIGQTAAAEDRKRQTSSTPALDDEALFELLRAVGDKEEEVGRRLFQWAVANGLRIWWGKTIMAPMWDHPTGGGHEFTFDIRPTGFAGVLFELMSRRPTFAPVELREELRSRLVAIPGVTIAPVDVEKSSVIPLRDLVQPGSIDTFLGAYDWVLEQFRLTWSTSPSPSNQSGE